MKNIKEEPAMRLLIAEDEKRLEPGHYKDPAEEPLFRGFLPGRAGGAGLPGYGRI